MINQQLLIEIQNLKNLATLSHYTCDDSWYSCPKSEEGCADESVGNDCTCGVDVHNIKVQECYDRLIKYLI